MEKLQGKWLQKEHTAEINGMECGITPPFEIEWDFAGKEILTMSTGNLIHHVCRVSQQPEAGIITLRPNFCDHPQVYAVRFEGADTVVLTAFTRTRDSIILMRMT